MADFKNLKTHLRPSNKLTHAPYGACLALRRHMVGNGLEYTSVASLIAGRISDFAFSENKNDILEEISIYGSGEPDGSAVMAFEWHGANECSDMSKKVLEFIDNIKKIVVESGREAVEQVQPHCNIFKDNTQILYRVRVWPAFGDYEERKKKVNNG